MLSNKEISERESWLKIHDIQNFSILPDGRIDVHESVYIRSNLNMKLPYAFRNILGDLKVDNCSFDNMLGFPERVVGNMKLHNSTFHSLEGITRHVGEHFSIVSCMFLSLEGIPLLNNHPTFGKFEISGINMVNNCCVVNEKNFQILFDNILADDPYEDVSVFFGFDFDDRFASWVNSKRRLDTIKSIVQDA